MTDIAPDQTDTSALFGTGDFFQRDNYAPVPDELTEFDLPVQGAIPAEFSGGTYATARTRVPRRATGSPATA